MSVFGLPFFAAGVFLFLTLIGVVPVSNANDLPALAWPLLVLMAIAFTAVGGTLVFGRSWTTVDREHHQVVKQWSLLTIPLREQTTPLAGYTVIRLGFVEGDSDSADRFPVAMKAPGSADLVLWNPTVYAHARDCARALAELLRLEIEDASTDHPVRLPASLIDVPLHERLGHDGAARNDAARPAAARSQVTREAGQVTIVIPSRPLGPLRWLLLAAGIIPIAILLAIGAPLATFFRKSQTPDPVAWFFLGFLTLFFGILPTLTIVNGFLRSRRGATIVTVSPRGLRITERGAWTTRPVASFEAPEILDIDYGSMKGSGLTLKTRTSLTTFGKGLDDEELHYLDSVARGALME